MTHQPLPLVTLREALPQVFYWEQNRALSRVCGLWGKQQQVWRAEASPDPALVCVTSIKS